MDDKRSALLHDHYYDTSPDAPQQQGAEDRSLSKDVTRSIKASSTTISAMPKGVAAYLSQLSAKGRGAFIRESIQTFKRHSKRSQLFIISLTLASVVLLSAIVYTAWFMLYPTPPITAFVVGQQRQVPRDVSGFGPVASLQQAKVTFAAPGHIVSLLVKPGDTVRQGTPVLKLDPSQLQAQVDLASNNVNARKAYLDAVSNAVPYNPITVAAAQQNYVVAQNQYRALMTQTNFPSLHNSDLISQIDGVVMQISVSPGDRFNANQVLMIIANQSSVVVNAKLSLDVRQYVHVDDPVQVNALGLRDINMQGKITAVVPQVDPQTDSFTVQVTIANPQADLWSGMNAYVQIHGAVDAYAIPRISVLNPDQESAVYIIQNGRVHIRQVHVIGFSPDGNKTYIDAGLNAGEQIVVLPLNRMHEGLPITIGTTER
jgi:RND family efflux transporter, MFP subunit